MYNSCNEEKYSCSIFQWHDNMEWYHTWITSFWLAAVAFGKLVRDPACKKIKSLTFLISDVKISHITEDSFHFDGKICSCGKLVLFCLPPSTLQSGITSQINDFILASSSHVCWMPPWNMWSFLQQDEICHLFYHRCKDITSFGKLSQYCCTLFNWE